MMETQLAAVVVGKGRSGKDTFARALAQAIGVRKPTSSSKFAAPYLWSQVRDQPSSIEMTPMEDHPTVLELKSEDYADFTEFYDDRKNHRQAWAQWIDDFNRPDALNLYRRMVKAKESILVGVRRQREFNAILEELNPVVTIWIDKDGLSEDPSCEISPDCCDLVIRNNRTRDDLARKAKLLSRLITSVQGKRPKSLLERFWCC